MVTIYDGRCGTCRMRHTAAVSFSADAFPTQSIKVECRHTDRYRLSLGFPPNKVNLTKR